MSQPPIDTRWSNPNHVALSNGPIRTITAPAQVHFNLNGDVQVVEFMLPFPMHIVDPQHWNPISSAWNGRQLFIHKPFVSMKGFEADGRLGTETPDAYCTLLRVGCEFNQSRPYPEPRELWTQVRSLLEWVRVKARHYWVLHGQTGFGSVSRGSVLSQRGKQIQMSNFATYVPVVIVRPLSQELWQTLSDDLAAGTEPPVCEALFCDALLSAAAGEDLNAVLQLGIAAEIAITRLLIEVADTPPTNPQKRKFLANGERDSFYVKLEDWPSKLALQSVKAFRPRGVMKDWVDVVKELYRLRGSVAHSGRVPSLSLKKNVGSYAFATNALIRYCREQRTPLGLPVYSYPAGALPFDQLEAFTDVVLDSVASPAVSTLP